MKQFLAHLFDKKGVLAHTLEIKAFTYDQAFKAAHEKLGTSEFLSDNDHELWVVPSPN